MTDSFELKISSASCNQTAGDWPRNISNICSAIDKAVADKSDILALEELGLTGYERGDDFYYSDNNKTYEMLKHIANYANNKDKNLIISIGHPWYFADKNLPSQIDRRKNPIYNRLDNNFNVQTLITAGYIISMSAKRYLFNYERGYEKRHFEEWSDEAANNYKNGRHGTIEIEIAKGKIIPFGSPVIQFGAENKAINITHIICEEYWIGSKYDSSIDNSSYVQDNPLARTAEFFDITVALNPNASPPVANKIDKHIELCKLASKYCGVFVHTDGLGSSGSTFAQFGSRIISQNGEIISKAIRNSFKDVAYSCKTVRVQTVQNKNNAPHAIIEHEFTDNPHENIQDNFISWEDGDNREFEEEIRNETLWLFDYARKNKIQGFVEALSGGADSGYNAAKTRIMVELAVSELGIEGFFNAMPHLKYKDEVLKNYKKNGIDALMKHMLVCVYMGTDNSSSDTLRAAKTLIEGGIDTEGKSFKGIGGEFHYRNVQRLVDLYAQIYAGVNPSEILAKKDIKIRQEIAKILVTRPEDTTKAELEENIDQLKSDFEEITYNVLSVAKEEHQIPYENIQARLRQVLIMLFANVENKLAISNPNLDEGRNSYATWGGDLHGGMISGNAHKNKQRQLDHMQILMEKGLQNDVEPIRGFYWILKNKPSAELQPLNTAGEVTQFDEDQLGRSFEQMDVISHFMLYDRPLEQHGRKNNPIEVFEKCRKHKAFIDDDLEVLHDRIRLSYDKWAHAQFKIHGSPVCATYGKNVDHQSSMRTPNISSNHSPELAELALYVLQKMFTRDGGVFDDFQDLKKKILFNQGLIDGITAKMWTPKANDGRKMKISTLYKSLKK